MYNLRLFKTIFSGLLSYVPIFRDLVQERKKRIKHSSSDALFCYSLWLGLIKYLENNKIEYCGDRVAELGTAGSFGVGLVALLTGTNEFYAFEIENLYKQEMNICLLDEIVGLLNAETDLCGTYSQLNIPITDKRFPSELITPKYKDRQFIGELKKELGDIFNEKNKYIRYVLNWNEESVENLDLIFSRAVMEHVKNPHLVYESIFSLLQQGGVTIHDIELHSHRLTKDPCGHRKLPAFLWRLINGRRAYSLNLLLLSEHIEIMNEWFEMLKVQNRFLSGYDNQREEDSYGAIVIGRKRISG